MISRTLIRLIDQAVVPAILLLSARVISVVMISYLGGIQFAVDATGFVFSSHEDYLYVNSYSTIAMVVVLALGLLYILLKAFLFHDTHISPGLSAKLFHYRLSVLIQSSFELYSQGVIWLAYLYLISAVTVILVLSNLIYPWVLWISLALSFISTGVLVFDIENEIELKKAEGEYIEDETPVDVFIREK